MFEIDENVFVGTLVVLLCALGWIVLLGTDEGALGELAVLGDNVGEAKCIEILDIEVGMTKVCVMLGALG